DARATIFPSDAATTPHVTRAGAAPDPESERKRIRKQRGLALVLIGVFLGGTAAAWFGDRGYLDNQRQQAQLRHMTAEHAAHLKRVQELKREVGRLKDEPSAVERVAREELGYVA